MNKISKYVTDYVLVVPEEGCSPNRNIGVFIHIFSGLYSQLFVFIFLGLRKV